MRYIHKEFPKFVYHKNKEACVVQDEKALKALGKGWVSSPALFKDEVKKKVKVKVKDEDKEEIKDEVKDDNVKPLF